MFERWRPFTTRQVERRTTPRTGEDAALAIELLRTVARNNRHSVIVLPLLASLIGLASLQWPLCRYRHNGHNAVIWIMPRAIEKARLAARSRQAHSA